MGNPNFMNGACFSGDGGLMTQTPNQEIRPDFETAVMQPLVGGGTISSTN